MLVFLLSPVHTSTSCIYANAIRMLTSRPCFPSEGFAGVEHSSTVVNYLLPICGFKILIAFAGSINQSISPSSRGDSQKPYNGQLSRGQGSHQGLRYSMGSGSLGITLDFLYGFWLAPPNKDIWIAQLVEHRYVKLDVVGSRPAQVTPVSYRRSRVALNQIQN